VTQEEHYKLYKDTPVNKLIELLYAHQFTKPKALTAWLEHKANRAPTYAERTAYSKVIKHTDEL